MLKIEFHKSLNEIFKNATSLRITTSEIELDKTDATISQLDALGISYDIVQQTKIQFDPATIPTKIFFDIDSFLKFINFKKDSDVYIYNWGEPLSYFDDKTYFKFDEVSTEFIFINALAYLDFVDFLKSQEVEVDETMHFIDAYNREARKIVMVSLSDKGRVTMTYGLEIPKFNRQTDLSKNVDEFKKCFLEPSRNLVKFLKAAIIKFVVEKPKIDRLQLLFENLDEVISKAHMNFEVYLNNLSIDKIKKDYDDVKSKFFKDLSDVLAKLTQQIVVLPIGFCAALLAVDKISENQFYLYFIVAALLTTSVYLSLLLRVQFKDLNYLNRLFNTDFSSIINNGFFIKYPGEKTIFEEVKTRFIRRLRFLKNVSEAYFWVLNLSHTAIICFIIKKVSGKFEAALLTGAFLALAMILARNFVRDEDEKEQIGEL